MAFNASQPRRSYQSYSNVIKKIKVKIKVGRRRRRRIVIIILKKEEQKMITIKRTSKAPNLAEAQSAFTIATHRNK